MLTESARPTVSIPLQAPVSPPSSRSRWWASALLVVGCWLLVFNQQRLEWTVNPTYSYGWAVPVLAAYLMWERWRSRPEPARSLTWFWWTIPVVLLLAYLPIRVIQEANPDWVKINWYMTAVALGLTLCGAGAIGGLRYVLYFAFPVVFCYTALPWPVWMEEFFTQSLMKVNASACAELLTLFGQPALAHGNLVQIGDAWVDVQEACSGIRSLQTAFMMSLFFGEFYRLGWIGRAGLLLSSFGVAFILNLARTYLLAHLTAVGGDALAEKWHDTVGLAVMFACLAALWALAELFQKRRRKPAAAAAPLRNPAARAPFPLWLALGGVAWLGVSEAATEAWYRSHERQMPAPIAWDMAWPEEAEGFRRTEFSERAQALLKYNEATSAAWTGTEGNQWQAYYLRWYPGRVSKILSGSHYPTVCLPATGLKLVAETGTLICQVGGLTIPFRTYLFDRGGTEVYVYHAILEDVPSPESLIAYRQAKSSERLQSVARGERNLGQRVIGVAIAGPHSPEQAEADLERMLGRMIHADTPNLAFQVSP